MLEYTKAGYESASKAFNPLDLEVDLTKRAIMVTGANAGIGRTTALEGSHIMCLFLYVYNSC